MRELRLDQAFIETIKTYEGVLPTSMEQLNRIVSKKDEQIEMLKLKLTQLEDQIEAHYRRHGAR